MNNEKKKEITELMGSATVVYVSSVDKDGYPNIKAMLALEREGIGKHYFSTNLSAKRTQRFTENSKACIYYCDNDDYKGLMLTGEMEVLKDRKHRQMLWRDGFEMYYPKGIDDEDYCVLRFTAIRGNYYHGLQNESFMISEF